MTIIYFLKSYSMKTKKTTGSIFIYSVGKSVCFVSDFIIAKGVITIKDTSGLLIFKKEFEGSNYDKIMVPEKYFEVNVNITSDCQSISKWIKF